LHVAGVKPKEIGILIVNCSLFNPTPSLAAMVINHFKVRMSSTDGMSTFVACCVEGGFVC
jgi:hypothetical protein